MSHTALRFANTFFFLFPLPLEVGLLLLLILGIYWIYKGIGESDSSLIEQGRFSIFFALLLFGLLDILPYLLRLIK